MFPKIGLEYIDISANHHDNVDVDEDEVKGSIEPDIRSEEHRLLNFDVAFNLKSLSRSFLKGFLVPPIPLHSHHCPSLSEFFS